MKQFFKMMFASALGGLVAIGAIIFITTFTLIGIAAAFGNQPEYAPEPNTVFKLSLNGSLQETAESNPLDFLSFGNIVSDISIKDVLKAIRTAKDDDRIRGIYLEAGVLTGGTAGIDAVRRALIDFKTSGKFVVAYGNTYTQGSYYLCSVADKVFLNPLGMVDIHGLTGEVTFYKGILRKVGVEMVVFKVGTYKGAVEPYMLDKLSDENREQIASYQQGIWNNIAGGIAQSRNLTPADVNDFANKGYTLAPAEKVVELGFVDELKYKPEAEEYVRELAGQTGKELKTAGLNKIRNIKEPPHKSNDEIAILYAEGEIVEEVTSSLYGSKAITDKMAGELAKLRKNEHVKAVVFRVNSPGGNAYVSDRIWREVEELRKEKPIVVSMGNVAASGGYYISCAASRIIAEANTLTGSIGVFGVIPNAAELYKMLDVTTEVVQTNTYGDLLNPARPLRADEKALLQGHVEHMYDVFLTRCADGRGKTREEIDRIGQGRVWTGQQALDNGLVDALGGIDEAIAAAAELAELTDYRITHVVAGVKDFYQELLGKQLEDLKLSLLKSVAGDEYKYLKALNDLKHHTGVQARLLYDIQPL
jgi:protease-4